MQDIAFYDKLVNNTTGGFIYIMSKLRRYLEPGASYYVTSVTNRREKIFLSPKVCKLFIVTMEFYKYYLDYKLYAFVVMPDHFHAIIEPGN